jgi:hypothetical protein
MKPLSQHITEALVSEAKDSFHKDWRDINRFCCITKLIILN